MEKLDQLMLSYREGRLGRREFLARAAAIGISAAGVAAVLDSHAAEASTFLSASTFNWKKFAGTTLYLLLNKHPYTDALLADLATFKALTGINVKYDIFPEDVYFTKVTTALSTKSTQYDAFMTGAYQTWVYGPAGWMVDLNTYMKDANKTNPSWDQADLVTNLMKGDAWDNMPGSQPGSGNTHQWALPWGFEINTVSYNRTVLNKYKVKLPANLPEMVETAAYLSKKVPGMYGIAVRGSRSWATIHPGYLSAFANYGAHDFDNKLKSAVASPQAVEMTDLWIKMVKGGGPKDWTSYTWYEVGNALGAGKAAMIFDADILGYFQHSAKAGRDIAAAPFAANPKAKEPTPNVWIWSLAMSNFSTKKDAAWYFLQWATGKDHATFGALHGDFVDPARASIWANPAFQKKMADYPGYLDTYKASIKNAKIYFTAEPLFAQVTTTWAAALQDMYAGTVEIKEGLQKLASDIDSQMSQMGL